MKTTKSRWLTDRQVSELTEIGLPTLRNHRCKGIGLPYVKFGRAVRYDIRDVESYMEARKIRTEPI